MKRRGSCVLQRSRKQATSVVYSLQHSRAELRRVWGSRLSPLFSTPLHGWRDLLLLAALARWRVINLNTLTLLACLCFWRSCEVVSGFCRASNGKALLFFLLNEVLSVNVYVVTALPEGALAGRSWKSTVNLHYGFFLRSLKHVYFCGMYKLWSKILAIYCPWRCC